MLAAYITTAMALTVAVSIFVKTELAALGVTWQPPVLAIYAVVSFLIWLFATRDIRLSSRVGLAIEAISVTLILIVCVGVLAKFGFQPDVKQLTLDGVSPSGVPQAIAFAIFTFIGFESAATLAKETRNPTVVIPRVITWTAIASGVFFVVTAYIVTIGFSDDAQKLGASSSPLADILTGENPLITAVVYFCGIISAFACALGALNAFGRLLYSLGRYQFVHQSMGMVHREHKTPHVALTLGAVVNFVLCAALINTGSETDTFGFYGTFAAFGFIVVYCLCSACAPIYLKKLGEASVGRVVLGALGVVLMIGAFLGNVYPAPAFPLNLLPYIFVAYLLIGVLWFFVLKLRSPQTLLGIEKDLEVAEEV
jgi:amino acid transporter